MAKALSAHQLNGFHYHIEEGWTTRDAARKVGIPYNFSTFIGWTTRDAARKVGIPYNFSTFIAAEYRKRKPVQIEQINEFEAQLEGGCTTAAAAETAGIPYRLASFIAGLVCTWQAMSLADERVAKRMAETECCHLHNEKDE